jgi:hypothetical protein
LTSRADTAGRGVARLPAFVTERDGHFAIDRSCFDHTTGRATTERVIIRDGRSRRFVFSVRMFVAAELRDCSTPDSPASISLTRTRIRLPYKAAA